MTRNQIQAATLAVLVFASCESSPASDPHVYAAKHLTERYARSPLASWSVKGTAAGSDCAVLLVETAIVMEDAMVEALHYGGDAYEIYDGGVEEFYRDHDFRGVAYRDSAQRMWTYGAIEQGEAESIARCH